ncbi:MAG: hypothetical protein QG657_3258 [Acidobacteriota bacterium]|nr:hypothetical protein [Acidobacteriota bacterium]
MSDTEKKRAKLTGIILNIQYPDGTPRIITLDPNETTGLFWSDQTVLEIFAPYYDNVDSEMTKDQFIEHFGPEAKKLLGKNDKIKITRNVVNELWMLPDKQGFLRAVLGKDTKCTPR